MNLLANILGVAAVVLYVLSYQMKRRSGIILMNAASRVLFVIQYILLGAVEGALMDVTAFFVSVLYRCRDQGIMKKYPAVTLILANIGVIGIGMLTYKNVFSLLPILGVICETLAFWLKRERVIRLVSLLGAPPWLVYNVLSGAYGSAVGNVITLVSIAAAILRYDILGKKTEEE